MHKMVNHEAGNNRVELAQRGQRIVEIVRDDADGGSPAKPLPAASSIAGEKSIATDSILPTLSLSLGFNEP
jgi:hypothetical protein